MTTKEAALVSAYTGFVLVKDFSSLRRFCEEILCQPVTLDTLTDKSTLDELHEKCRPMIEELIENETLGE